MKTFCRTFVLVFLLHSLKAFSLTNVEMLLFNTPQPFALSPSIQAVAPNINDGELAIELSPVVRIESLQKSTEVGRPLERFGTGVIIGRYKDNADFNFLHYKSGILVLTANHVLVGDQSNENNLISNLTFFKSNRQFFASSPYKILTTLHSEDLALLEVEMSWDQSSKINLPTLGLLEPEEFSNYRWIPEYYRVNPGPINSTNLSYSVITPKDSVSMMTQDGINSLAVFTKYFWYIPSEFSPGMSGGPIFTDKVYNSNQGESERFNHLLVGVMGYIFDTKTQYGYAYPLTKNYLVNLFKTDYFSTLKFPLKKMRIHNLSNEFIFDPLNYYYTSKVYKKRSPDFGVADEVSITLIENTNTIETRESIEFIQSFNFDPIFSLDPQPINGVILPNTPGGGHSEGTPGGGPNEGTPGGGASEGTPGGNSTPVPSNGSSNIPSFIKGFKQNTFIELVINSNDPKMNRTFSLESIESNRKSHKIEYLKDFIALAKNESENNTDKSKEDNNETYLNLYIKPIVYTPLLEKKYAGYIDLNLLKESFQELKELGFILIKGNQFTGKHLLRPNGLTMNLAGTMSDTKTGISKPIAISLGLTRDAKTGKIKEAVIAKLTVNQVEMNLPETIQFRLENNILKALYNDQTLIEVRL